MHSSNIPAKSQLYLDYQERFGEGAPEVAHKLANIYMTGEAMDEATQEAIQTGVPVLDWMGVVAPK